LLFQIEEKTVWISSRQMSVQDATISPSTKIGDNMDGMTVENLPLSDAERYNPNVLVTYKAIENGETRYETRKINELEWDMDQFRKLRKSENTWWNKSAQLGNIITDAYADSDDQETLMQIAELFGISMTKQVEYTATITVSGVVEVDLTDVYDLSEIVYENISIQGNGELEVHDFDIYSVEEL